MSERARPRAAAPVPAVSPGASWSSGSARWGVQNEFQDGKGRSGQTLSAVGFSAVVALAGLLSRKGGFNATGP